MSEAKCKDCGFIGPIAQFSKPVPTYCKTCAARRNKEWRHKQRAIVLATLPPKLPATHKKCKMCAQVLSIDSFYQPKGQTWRHSYCKPCSSKRTAELRKTMPSSRAEEKLKYKTKRMGTTPEWFNETLNAQNGVCAICKCAETHPIKRSSATVRSLAIDHDHETGKVRGLLCFRCNTSVHLLDKFGIGWLKEATRYLGI